MRVHERKRKSRDVMFKRDTVLGPASTMGGAPRRILRRSTMEATRQTTLDDDPMPTRRTLSFHNFTGKLGNVKEAAEKLVADTGRFIGGWFIRKCDEPVDARCSGDCKQHGPATKADVVRVWGVHQAVGIISEALSDRSQSQRVLTSNSHTRVRRGKRLRR